MGRVCSKNEKRNAYNILVRKLEGKRPLGRPRRRWVDNVKMDLREIGWDGIDWLDMAQDRDQWRSLVNIKCCKVLEWLTIGIFSRKAQLHE
jgi:hypothetical protein